ncbi:MAG: pyridoxamine 5'-phosphate oxidase family protein [Caldilineales bacterium]|nr:pyridoxamine 5'-phosphate oxidase family protein [Caldilineales bacterium]
MADHYAEITDKIQTFIEKQKLFFVATAAPAGRINLSPKGMDSLRLVDANTVVWLNLTGSGNETAAHLAESDRMTIMFCSFDREPLILRLYGAAVAYHRLDEEWPELVALFPDFTGARQCIRMNVDLVQTSCGFAVPFYDFVSERDALVRWHDNRGPQGIAAYWEEANQISLDGKPTGILAASVANLVGETQP